MTLPPSSRLVPLGASAVLHTAAFVLAVGTLGWSSLAAPAAYVPWLVVAGFVLGASLILGAPSPVPMALGLAVWTLAVQLVLVPPGFSSTFQILVMAPLLVQTVLGLPPVVGPVFALVELAFFLAGQGTRTAWGLEVAATADETLWGLGAVGLTLVAGAGALRSAFRQRDDAVAELVHLKEGVQQIVQANVGFQEMANEVEQTSVRRERLRITREIHDIVGYTLTNQTMVLQAASVLLDRDHAKLRDLLDSAEESARAGLQEVRQALRQLRDGADRPVAFLNRLHHLCRTFDQATSVKVVLAGARTPDNLPPHLELVLYRIVQEGLTNAFLHGKATRVTVSLALEGGWLTCTLADNGTGASQVEEGIGLAGMRERLAPYGGTLEYRGSDHGFTVWARVPWAAPEKETL
jgi:signal transduction histidine kinase